MTTLTVIHTFIVCPRHVDAAYSAAEQQPVRTKEHGELGRMEARRAQCYFCLREAVSSEVTAGEDE